MTNSHCPMCRGAGWLYVVGLGVAHKTLVEIRAEQRPIMISPCVPADAIYAVACCQMLPQKEEHGAA